MTILECRSCGDRWEPLFDAERNQPGVKTELTFCRLCARDDAETVVLSRDEEDENVRESEEED